MHIIDPAQLEPRDIYGLMIRCIVPRPIAWVTTISSSGVVNLAPFSYFNGVGTVPASLAFSVSNHIDGRLKDTATNILETRQFVVNVVPRNLAETMHQTSADYPPEVDELAVNNLRAVASQRVRPPRVAESPVHLECELIEHVVVGRGPLAANLFIGQILLVHVEPAVLDERGRVDPQRIDLVGRMGGLEYTLTRDRFALPPARKH